MIITVLLVATYVHDIREFGAVADDKVADNLAIQQAVEAASLDGYPVYIPPGIWDLESRSQQVRLGNPNRLASVMIRENNRPVTIYGEGPQSVLRMSGDGYGGDWWAVTVYRAHDVTIRDLAMDSTGRTGGFAEQQHLLQIYRGSTRVRVENVTFLGSISGGKQGGDCIRLLGDSGADAVEDVSLVRIRSVVCDRSVVSFQRGVRRVSISDLTCGQVSDQCIDFEPTGLSSPELRIQDVTLSGIVDTRVTQTYSLTLFRADRIRLLDSFVNGRVYMLECNDCWVERNVIQGQVLARDSNRVSISNNRTPEVKITRGTEMQTERNLAVTTVETCLVRWLSFCF